MAETGEDKKVVGKNILIDGDRITFIANVGHGTVWASFLYLGMTLALFLPSLGDRLGYGIVILQAIALPDLAASFLYNLVNWSRRTVFDGAAGEVRHANMLGARRPLPFREVADFVRVRSGFADGARYAYRVTRIGRRFGAGWELVPFRPDGDGDLVLAEKRVLPALRRSVAEETRRSNQERPAEHGTAFARYTWDGTSYRRIAVKKSPVFAALIVVLLLTPFPTTAMGILVLLVAAAVHSLFGISRITIHPRERLAYIATSPFAKKVEVSFDEILGFEQLHNISIFQPVSICLRYREGDSERSALLCCTYLKRIAEAVADETEILLGISPRNQLDNTYQSLPSNASVLSPDTRTP